ncbi:MAG: FAD/NAD(P)-binding protein, partial [Acidimicrobiales bacterium]
MGEYLAWFYRVLVLEAPGGVTVVHHETTATDIVEYDDRERVHLADGTAFVVDQAILTTGQTPNSAGPCGPLLPAYPIERLDDSIAPGSAVAVQGMGLVAIDVVMALTVGRGGRFVRRGDRLHYEACGNEPRLAMFSRSGFFYCSKSIGRTDITGEYHPRICTPEAVDELRFDEDGKRRAVDARRELVPLLLAEMTTCFYAQSARLAEGPGAGTDTADRLADAWLDGSFEEAVASCADRYGVFDAHRHFFVGENDAFVSAKDYEARVAGRMEGDIAAALVPDGSSPVKLAYEVLRALRDTVRSVVEFGGLTLESHRDFQADVRKKMTRIVAGPPVYRNEQLLALMDAGILTMPFGPAPVVLLAGTGAVVRSRHLDRPHGERFDHVVLAHLDQPTVHGSSSPMLRELYRRGRVRQFQIDGEDLGSIDLSHDFHPIARDGTVQRRLWVFGALSEGPRYFTAYIPSPSSRVRAFVDAQLCAEQILGGAR